MFFYPVRVISRLIQIKTNLTVQPIGKLDMTFFKTILGKEIDRKSDTFKLRHYNCSVL